MRKHFLGVREVCVCVCGGGGGGGGPKRILGESHGFQGEAVVSNRL